jgi:hypothetical protein
MRLIWPETMRFGGMASRSVFLASTGMDIAWPAAKDHTDVDRPH